jgi:hypothetical protein
MDSASKILWKPVPGSFSSRYEVSNLGQVRNKITSKILTPMMTGQRRRGGQTAKVRFSSNPRVDYSVADLVLTCFVSEKPLGFVAMHKDDNKGNNALSNLSWGTQQQNVVDMIQKCRGGSQKLTAAQVLEIVKRRKLGESGRSLAAEFHISEQRVCDLFKGRTCLC